MKKKEERNNEWQDMPLIHVNPMPASSSSISNILTLLTHSHPLSCVYLSYNFICVQHIATYISPSAPFSCERVNLVSFSPLNLFQHFHFLQTFPFQPWIQVSLEKVIIEWAKNYNWWKNGKKHVCKSSRGRRRWTSSSSSFLTRRGFSLSHPSSDYLLTSPDIIDYWFDIFFFASRLLKDSKNCYVWDDEDFAEERNQERNEVQVRLFYISSHLFVIKSLLLLQFIHVPLSLFFWYNVVPLLASLSRFSFTSSSSF